MEEYLEKNENTLYQAIAGLPEHRPPARIWLEIERGLERQENMQTALQGLPQHAAPTRIWDNIAQALDKPRSRPFVYRILHGTRPWIAAATLCGLALGAWWFIDSEVPARTSIAYFEEIQEQVEFAEDWNDEESQITLVLQQVASSPVADPRVVSRLKLEFNELTDARSEVEDMLKRYGRDEALLKEIARIERERSQVIKELAAWI